MGEFYHGNLVYLSVEDEHQNIPGWYFIDETENIDGNGPYLTQQQARQALNAYCIFLEGEVKHGH